MAEVKAGPLTVAEIQAIWEGATDKGYRDPLVQAGEGNGFEAWTQLFEQFARASKAIDVTTQAMFISSWSGQTNPPASGAVKSLVTLKISRTGMLDKLLLLGAGTTYVGEVTNDSGENGSEEVVTGRRYVLLRDVVFHPGEAGPFEVQAEAEFPGYGYDNPLPGTIKRFSQPATGFNNDLATIVRTTQPANAAGTPAEVSKATADAHPDMFVPDHVGQYVIFTAGSNVGKVARAAVFEVPQPTASPPIGSAVQVDRLLSVVLGSVTGSFAEGEIVDLNAGAGYGRVVGTFDGATKRLGIRFLNGSAPSLGQVVTGSQTGATGTILQYLHDDALTNETATAAWRVLDWATDWGLIATHDAKPAGGKAAWLDELGNERNIHRGPGESDESYRARVREIADVVTPNAIRRSLIRTMGDIPWCLREVGGTKLPGFFYDGTNESPSATPHGGANDAYDYDTWTFSAGSTAGTFIFQEAVEVYVSTAPSVVIGRGWFGSINGGTFVVIRQGGVLDLTALAAGTLRIRGMSSGAVRTPDPGSYIDNAQLSLRRYRLYLDYEQFRAFFVVSIPTLSIGEFGFAYDAVSKLWGYDLPMPWSAGYDGFASASGEILRRAWEEIDRLRAGGVGFEFRRDDGTCA